jgi:hypothetical protein
LIIICYVNLWAYVNHLNRLDLFIELVRNNKTDLIVIIFPFILICFCFLIILNLSGWTNVIYLDLFDFQHNEYSHKWFIIFTPICASALPIILFLCEIYFLKMDNSEIGSFICIGITFLLNIVLFYVITKRNGSVKLKNEIISFCSLFFYHFLYFTRQESF